MKTQKQKAKSKRPRTKLTKQGQKALEAALKPYENKHPVYVALETLEEQVRRLLEADGFPVDMDTLAQYHHAPLGPRANKKAEEEWLKNFQEYHLRFFPQDRDKVLTRRGALLKQILWQAERVREAIGSGDPEGAALHGIRLMQWAARAGMSLETSKAAKHERRAKGILYAIEEEIEDHGGMSPRRLWEHLAQKHKDDDIELEEDDFRGKVWFDNTTEELVQEPSRKSGDRPARIGYKAFEGYFYQVLHSRKPT